MRLWYDETHGRCLLQCLDSSAVIPASNRSLLVRSMLPEKHIADPTIRNVAIHDVAVRNIA